MATGRSRPRWSAAEHGAEAARRRSSRRAGTSRPGPCRAARRRAPRRRGRFAAARATSSSFFLSSSSFWRARSRLEPRDLQLVLDARHHLLGLERLGDVVHAAGAECLHLAEGVVERADEDHGDLRERLRPPSVRCSTSKPFIPGMRMSSSTRSNGGGAPGRSSASAPLGRRLHVVPLALEDPGQDVAIRLVVVNDEQAARLRSRTPLSPRRRAGSSSRLEHVHGSARSARRRPCPSRGSAVRRPAASSVVRPVEQRAELQRGSGRMRCRSGTPRGSASARPAARARRARAVSTMSSGGSSRSRTAAATAVRGPAQPGVRSGGGRQVVDQREQSAPAGALDRLAVRRDARPDRLVPGRPRAASRCSR